jgi:hypothetical protein
MTTVTEVVQIDGGRAVKINFTEEEIKHVINAGVNYLLQEGLLTLSATDDVSGDTEVIGTKQAIKESTKAIKESKRSTKQ